MDRKSGHKHRQIFIRMESRGKLADKYVSADLTEVELC